MRKKLLIALSTTPQGGAFLVGKPGTGKTFAAESIAKELGAKVFFYQLFPGVREEDFLQKLIPDEGTKSGIKMIDGVLISAIKSANSGDLTVLILDEWDKSRPSADSFLLDFIQSGRVNWNGVNYTISDRDKFKLFLTLNDEREISEALLRRLPVIKFEFMPVSQIRTILQAKHGEHPLINPCLKLYENSINAGLNKPATVQELSQLISAADSLGSEADWNELVYMFITKTDEQHRLLVNYEQTSAEYESDDESNYEEEEISSDPTYYEDPPQIEEEELKEEKKPRMPHIREYSSFTTSPEEDIDISSTGGYIEATEDSYSHIAKECELDENKLEVNYKLANGYIIYNEPLPFNKKSFKSIPHYSKGEILLIGENIDFNKVKSLLSHKDWLVKNIEDNLVIAKYGSYSEFCYNKQSKKIEIIVKPDGYHDVDFYQGLYNILLEDTENTHKNIQENKNISEMSNSEIYKTVEDFIGSQKSFTVVQVWRDEIRIYLSDKKIGRFDFANKDKIFGLCEEIFSIFEKIKDRDFVFDESDEEEENFRLVIYNDSIKFVNLNKLEVWYNNIFQETQRDLKRPGGGKQC